MTGFAIGAGVAIPALIVMGLALWSRGNAIGDKGKAQRQADAEAHNAAGYKTALEAAREELDEGTRIRAAQDARIREGNTRLSALRVAIARFETKCPNCGADISGAADDLLRNEGDRVGLDRPEG